MPILITFKSPKPGKKVFPRPKSETYEKWFERFDEAPLRSFKTTEDSLVNYALDCGYGDIEQQELLLGMVDAGSRERLNTLMMYRWQSVIALLYLGPGTNIYLHPVADKAETSDKGSAAFVLGGMCARFAMETHLGEMKPPRNIKKFLHRSLYADPRIAKVVHASGLVSGESRPDYVVLDSGGEWHVVEAKGSFGKLSNKRMVRGLGQALNISTIETTESPGVIAPPISASVVGSGFSDAASAMSILHIDPPVMGDEIRLEICPELADLTSYMTRVELWRAVTDERFSASEFEARGYQWTPLAYDGDGRIRFIGIAARVMNRLDEIKTAVAVVGYYVPAVTQFAEAIERAGEQDGLEVWRTLIRARRDLLASYILDWEDKDIAIALDFGDALLAWDIAPLRWTEGVQRMLRTELPVTQGSAEGLHGYLYRGVQAAALDTDLQVDRITRPNGQLYRFQDLNYGLAIIS